MLVSFCLEKIVFLRMSVDVTLMAITTRQVKYKESTQIEIAHTPLALVLFFYSSIATTNTILPLYDFPLIVTH